MADAVGAAHDALTRDQPPAGAAPTQMVTYDEVGKLYESRRGGVLALRDVSFAVERGQFVSLLGQSGCGKSTLLKMTAGVTDITSGTIEIDGRPVDGPVDDLGMVFQTPVLLEWRDVLGNIVLPLEILRRRQADGTKRAQELVEMVGLTGFEHRYPAELSGGMQQRVAICRALMIDPPLLLMDEPFGALDALTRDEMAVELLRIWEQTQKTIIFVTHSIDEAVLLSDRVVVMSPRPGTVALTVDIDLPRPRTADLRYDPRFVEFSHRLRSAIEQGRRRRDSDAEGSAPGDEGHQAAGMNIGTS
jgi:NitT/TauT family transport system ATP-binding protein